MATRVRCVGRKGGRRGRLGMLVGVMSWVSMRVIRWLSRGGDKPLRPRVGYLVVAHNDLP